MVSFLFSRKSKLLNEQSLDALMNELSSVLKADYDLHINTVDSLAGQSVLNELRAIDDVNVTDLLDTINMHLSSGHSC